MRLEPVDVLKIEIAAADPLHHLHHFDKPTPRSAPGLSQEECLFPFRYHRILRFWYAIADHNDAPRLRHIAEEDIGADPAGATRGRCQRLALLDDVRDKEMLGHDAHGVHFLGGRVISKKQKVGVGIRLQTIDFCVVRAVCDRTAEGFAILRLNLELVLAARAEKVRDRRVGRKLVQLGSTAVRAVHPVCYPTFCPIPGLLRRACVARLRLLETQFHVALTPQFRRQHCPEDGTRQGALCVPPRHPSTEH